VYFRLTSASLELAPDERVRFCELARDNFAAAGRPDMLNVVVCRLAQMLFQAGRASEALTVIENVLNQLAPNDPDRAEALTIRGYLLLNCGEFREALQVLKAVQPVHPYT